MSQERAELDRTEFRSTGTLVLILTALAAVLWVTSPTASGDQGRSPDGLSAEVSSAVS
jgi:hypothetical protein